MAFLRPPLVLMLVLAGLLGCQEAPSPARVAGQACELLDDKGYEPRVLELLRGARERIEVTMFSALLPADAGTTHPVRLLLDALVERHRAGVAVRVVLDAGAPSGQGRPSERAYQLLEQAGVPVRWDEDDRTTHSKTLVVDGRWCVVGSHNWTFSALRRNREQSLLVEDPALAGRLGEGFDRLWSEAGRPAAADQRKRSVTRR
jgi:phosphatidylserine/phosphatidylglycerophosphate/cardiolipin synthase-like enzyme